MRDKIFFDSGNHESIRHRMHEAGLSTSILLDSIGYSSLAFNWASLRENSSTPIEKTRQAWGHIYRKFEEDWKAQDIGKIPRELSPRQEYVVQSVFDQYEQQLLSLTLPLEVAFVGFVLPPHSEPQYARTGLGGAVQTRQTSPLYQLLTAEQDPHRLWIAGEQNTHQVWIAIIPLGFTQPFVNWVHARGGRVFIKRKARTPADPYDAIERVKELPISEYIGLLDVNNADFGSLEKGIAGVLDFMIQ
jgi:hypothetical protein